jgi:hypothetical protein
MKRSLVRVPFFLLLLFLCSGSSYTSIQQRSKDSFQIAQYQLSETAERLEKAHQIVYFGNGMKEKFRCLELYFHVHRKLSKDEARELLLACAEEFMDDINANEELRPHLLEFPFTLKNVGICFAFMDEAGTEFCHPDFSRAAWCFGKMEFVTKDPNKNGGFKQIDEETHEEALALIKASQ